MRDIDPVWLSIMEEVYGGIVQRVLQAQKEQVTPWFCTVIYPPEAVKHARQIYDVDKKQMVLVHPNQPPVWKGETNG